jgi:hypothetical protein
MPSTVVMQKSTIIDHAGSSNNYHIKSSSSYYNQNSYAETLTEVIVDEAAKLYEKMVKDFTNEALTNAIAVRKVAATAILLH